MSEFQENVFPDRVKIMTWNVWGNNRWPERESPLLRTLHSSKPDVLLLQEVCPQILAALDTTLSDYSRIVEPDKKGWNNESNIYYNHTLLKKLDHGASKLDMDDHPDRGLFWARFEILEKPITFFVSTVHMPWAGCATEIETGMNQRIPCTIKVIEQLRRVCPLGEPSIVAGDFNDDFHPVRILQEELGFTDVFELLDMVPPITHPVRSSSLREVLRPDRTLDWITCLLPAGSSVVGAYAKTMRGIDCASDHLPLIAFFEFREKLKS